MEKLKKFSMMAPIVLTIIIIGLISCKDKESEPEPKPDLSALDLFRKWYIMMELDSGIVDRRYYLEFKEQTYFYISKDETINGLYLITEKEKSTYDVLSKNIRGEEIVLKDFVCTLYKMNASGSNVFDQLWVYCMRNPGSSGIIVHAYSNNEFVRNFGGFYGAPL